MGEQKDVVAKLGQFLRNITERGLQTTHGGLVDAVHAIIPLDEVRKSDAHLASIPGQRNRVSSRVTRNSPDHSRGSARRKRSMTYNEINRAPSVRQAYLPMILRTACRLGCSKSKKR